jgi:mannose-6-phosphate isomerase-like protein (cupin superfamily)
MSEKLQGGVVFTVSDVKPNEYLPNKGVWLAQMLGKPRGDAFGLYQGKIDPGCGIAREVHANTSETVWVIGGEAMGLCGDREVPLRAGQVMHVDKNVPHGIRNVGTTPLELVIIGHPDF